MTLNRREMLRLGAYGAAGAILSSAASSSAVPSLLLPTQPVPGTPNPSPLIQPAAPTAPAGIDPQLFARAKAALDSHRIYPRDSIAIVDFSAPSSDPRFHVVDLMNGTVQSHRVAHGRGSDPDHSGFVERFSNEYSRARARFAPTTEEELQSCMFAPLPASSPALSYSRRAATRCPRDPLPSFR